MRLLRIALIGFALLAVACYALMLVWTGPIIEQGAGGLPMLDFRADGYGFDETVLYLNSLTPEARSTYLGPQRVLDTVFPVALAGTLALAIILALGRKIGRLALALALVPLVFLYVDLLENAAVSALLRSAMPDPAQVEIASLYTVVKFQLVAVSCLILALGLFSHVVSWSLEKFKRTG